MKGIQPPQIPRHLDAQEIRVLADHSEYAALRLAKCDWTGQTAEDILFEQVEFRRAVFQGSKVTGARLFDVRADTTDFSSKLAGRTLPSGRTRRLPPVGRSTS